MSRQRKEEYENTYVDDRIKILLPKFEALAPYKINDRKKGKDGFTGWEQLASQEVRLLKVVYPDDKPEGEKTYGAAYRQSQALKKALRAVTANRLKDPMVINQFQTIVKNFSLAITFLFSEYKAKQNEIDDQKVTERRKPENRVILDLTNSLKYAYNILTDIKNGENANWLDVSCAVCLATGRRMGEIHLSASFEKIDDYNIIFKGQLKGKGRKVRLADKAIKLIDVPFPIPVILPADLVIFALDWLGKKGKRFDRTEDPERVNRRFSKPLNIACKDWDIFPKEERTYHKFRAAYLRSCIINDGNVDPYDFTDFAKKILCDNDEAAINAYKRYEIKEGSLTKI